MTELTAVSVIIPTYNRVQLLPQAIESVFQQTYPDIELIVVDDGSIDGTGDFLSGRYGERLRYVYQANKGVSAARNRGLMLSRGRYVLFLDSDDALLPHALELEASYLDDHPEIGLVYTDGFFCDESGKEVSLISAVRPPHHPGNILEDLVVSNVILACNSAMVRRSALDTVGPPYFDETLGGTEDQDLWIRLASYGTAFAYIPQPTCCYRVHDSNTTLFEASNANETYRGWVKKARFKTLNAGFFSQLEVETRERFFYQFLRVDLDRDEPAREEVLSSSQFAELPSASRAELFYRLALKNVVDEGTPALGRGRLRDAVNLEPRCRKYQGMLLVSYLGPMVRLVTLMRRWLKRLGKRDGGLLPIDESGLRSV